MKFHFLEKISKHKERILLTLKRFNIDNINSKRLYKNKYENIVYKNYNNNKINIDVNIIYCYWVLKFDIVQVAKFKTRSKSMTLLITKWDGNCVDRGQVNERLTELKKKCFWWYIWKVKK